MVRGFVIVSFKDNITEEFYLHGTIPKKACGWATVSKIVSRKLDMLDAAAELRDLRSPPGNQLELLKGDLAGHYSIRINDQWRIVFRWSNDGPQEVQITDYH